MIYGPPGSPAELHFTGMNTFNFHDTFADGPPRMAAFTAGKSIIRILAISDALADRTWFVDDHGMTQIVCGPAYVGTVTSKPFSLTTEQPWDNTGEMKNAWVYGSSGMTKMTATGAQPAHPTRLALGTWQARIALPPDTGWRTSRDPEQMGADGDLTADAWYRAAVTLPQAGTYILDLTAAADRLTAYLDGAPVTQDAAPRNSLVFTATAGTHTLTVFTAHDGRPDFFPWLGPITTKYAKGLLGPADLSHLPAPPRPVTGWRVLKLSAKPGSDALPPSLDTPGWQDYKVGDSLFHNSPGYAWFALPVTTDSSNGQRTSLHCDSVDFGGTVYLNGKLLPGAHGYNEPFEVPLNDGPNTVAILVENNYGRGGLSPTTLVMRAGPPMPVTGWSLRGGPGDPNTRTGWQAVGASGAFDGPMFFRTTFTASPPPTVGPHPIWRVVSAGLGHGSVWVNGHNLGRYPEKIAVNGLYIPECWLRPTGQNSLVIYDEDGRRPDQVTVAAETAASRDVLWMGAAH